MNKHYTLIAPLRVFVRVCLICGIVATVILGGLLYQWFRDSRTSQGLAPGETVYTPNNLKNRNLPQWDLTNAIPLAPDKALLAAFDYASKLHPKVLRWDTDRIELNKEFDKVWVYDLLLIDRTSDQHETEDVMVLMDGSIWLPTNVGAK